MDVALVGLLGVVAGGVIGLAAQLLTSRIAVRQTWADTRRVVYSDYLEKTSVARRQLDDAARALAEGRAPVPGEPVDPRAAHLQSVAGWNRVRLISRSDRVQSAARELSVRIQELRHLLEGGATPTTAKLEAINDAYERDRSMFIEAAQDEIGLARRTW